MVFSLICFPLLKKGIIFKQVNKLSLELKFSQYAHSHRR